MANGGASLLDLRNVVARALHDGVEAARLPLVDDDDPIGDPAVFSVSATRIADMNVGDSFNVLREVSGNDARYTLTFEVRRLA